MDLKALILSLLVIVSVGCDKERDAAPLFKNATTVIHALDEYRFSKGVYPSDLDKLAPEFLAEIPSPEWGRNQWKYTLDGGVFRLEVLESIHSEYIGYSYWSDDNRWFYSSS